ncbi:hypothetical protein YQ44_09990 [Janthinobacterium sp. 1_2014MBL_MicDiv]|nr:hypothetical protein YQ44_09990 [Janthinobacterium sp. 1_2014MBL_MicDiv]
MEYGGCWRRLGAFCIDQIIVSLSMIIPVSIVLTASWALDTPGPTLIYQEFMPLCMLPVMLAYNVFLVARYGVAPGMWLCKLKLQLQDGSAVTSRAAWLRYGVVATLYLLASLPKLWHFLGLSFPGLAGQTALSFENAYAWELSAIFLAFLWMLSEFIVLMLNKQRRALQDFMAGTVVVKLPARATQAPPLASTPT